MNKKIQNSQQMYCKLEEADMTPNSFSMNTILTSEKQKLNEDHEELKLQHLQLAQQQAATQQTPLMGLQPQQHPHHHQQHPQHTQHHHQQPQHTQHHQKQQMLTTTDCNGNEEIIQQTHQQSNKKQKIIDDDLPKKEELSSEAKHVHVNLDESELWKKFKSLTNEMIVTKNGRYG